MHWLIKAYKKLDTDKKLVLVGESPYPSKYKDYLVDLAKGDDDIIFTGYQTGKYLDQLFTNAYMYVHPSEAEGLAITILEAMSYGRTVLISDIPENLEVLSIMAIGYPAEKRAPLSRQELQFEKVNFNRYGIKST